MVENDNKTVGAAPTKRKKKKKSFVIRDVYNLYKSMSRLWPRDKTKSEAKLKTESKGEATKDQAAQTSEDSDEGVKLCRVRSYRRNYTDFLPNKPCVSRSWSQNAATQTRALSSLKKSKSSRVDSNGFPRSLTTTASTTANPIMYSSSSRSLGKPPPTEKELGCTLEELCNGCTKMIKIKRDVLTNTGQTSQEDEMVKIKVKPGWKNGTKVTFEGKGNEEQGRLPADLIFVIAEKEHEVFKRQGDDLEMEVEIPLVEALTGCNLSIPLPDGEKMSLRIDDIIYPQSVKIIQGRGMPRPKDKGKRGDLRIKFLTAFPTELTDDQKEEVRTILDGSTVYS